MEKFLIIDGNSIAYRAAVACNKDRELINSKGRITGGTFRFINILNKILEMSMPTHVIVCFDTSKHTFRHDLYSQYKSNRNNKNEGLYKQFDDIKTVLELIGIKHDNVLNYEGDDLVGTYHKISKADKNFILSGDADIFQLIDENTFVIFPKVGVSEVSVLNLDRFKNRFNIDISQYIDYKCLLGDKSDNIPGLPKCGEKSVQKLLNKYNNIDNILLHLEDDSKDIRGWKNLSKSLKDWSCNYNIVKQLVTIRKDVPVKYTYDDCKVKIDWENCIPFLQELECNSIIKRIKGGKLFK